MYQELIDKKAKLAVIGLGYVGLPIALEFAKRISVKLLNLFLKTFEVFFHKIFS